MSRVDHTYSTIPEDELDERSGLMLEEFGGLASADYCDGALLFTVGSHNEVLDVSRATTIFWRCDQWHALPGLWSSAASGRGTGHHVVPGLLLGLGR